jgi:Transposase DDE domain
MPSIGAPANDASSDTYTCPAEKTLTRRNYHPARHYWEYKARVGDCAACALRSACTNNKTGRTINRHEHQELLERGRRQSFSPEAVADRKRRQHLMERSFADAANNHRFKRARWRGLWKQAIQDLLIATCQNLRKLAGALWRLWWLLKLRFRPDQAFAQLFPQRVVSFFLHLNPCSQAI